MVAVLVVWLFTLLRVLVPNGLVRSPDGLVARSAPISLPGCCRQTDPCSVGYPVAQACPDRAVVLWG